jgi:hypothetical protein
MLTAPLAASDVRRLIIISCINLSAAAASSQPQHQQVKHPQATTFQQASERQNNMHRPVTSGRAASEFVGRSFALCSY